MTAKPTERRCNECGNVNDSAEYCPDCGCGEWVERVQFDFERDVDPPVIFETSVYNDTYGMWDAFCEQTFGRRVKGSQIANLPDGLPRMKYYEVSLYWVLTEDYELNGPFLDEREAREEL